MKNPFVSILCTLVFSGSIIFSVVFAKKQQVERYQLSYGTICKKFPGKVDGNIETLTEKEPICLRIDTATGKTWIYENNAEYLEGYINTDGKRTPDAIETTKGFTEMSFESEMERIERKK